MDVNQFDKAHAEEAEQKKRENQELMADAKIIARFLENPPEGWNVIMKYFSRHKDWLHSRCFNRNGLPEEPVARLIDTEVYMLSYLELKYIIEMPENIIKKGEKALESLVEQEKNNQKRDELLNEANDPVMKR